MQPANQNSSRIPLPSSLETGDPAADPRMFRRCLGQYGTGIAIITTQCDGQRAAITVNSFASVSLDPPLVLWSVAHTSRSHALFTRATHFGINILSATQMDVSRHFSSKVEDKFADAAWAPGEGGAPLIDGSLVQFECELHSQIEGGDHTILMCTVKRASRYEGEPLLFSQGQYSVADAHPAASISQEIEGNNPPTWFDETIISQIFQAHHLISQNFDEHRRAENVSTPVARVLTCLYDTPGLSLEEVSRATYLGQRDTEDAVAALKERSMLHVETNGRFALTDPGRTLLENIRNKWKVFQQEQLAEISEKDARVTARTLTKLINQNRTKKI